MQRVLSFQMAQGVNESSEFVTKRMCFSFLFSVGFLCLLCGFLLGRFATERSIEYRTEKKRLEFIENGLDSTLQKILLQEIKMIPIFMGNSTINSEVSWLQETKEFVKKNILSTTTLFQESSVNNSYLLLIAKGSRESDRYVIVSVSEAHINIALQLAKMLDKMYNEYNWKPRRTIFLCLSFNAANPCLNVLPSFLHHQIIAYLSIRDSPPTGDNTIMSGSDIIQSIVLDIIDAICTEIHVEFKFHNWDFYERNFQPALHVPHVVFSFVNIIDQKITNQHKQKSLFQHMSLTEIFGLTMWRLSESLLLKWNPKYLNDTVNSVLNRGNISDYSEIKAEIKTTLNKLILHIKTLYENVNTVDDKRLLSSRMLNDVLVNLDRTLLCSDNNLSRTGSGVSLYEKSNSVSEHLSNMLNCYRAANQIIENW